MIGPARRAAALIATLPLIGTTPAAAAQTNECDWVSSAFNLAEPWAENTRTFANGAIRIALLDTAEPAAASFHLLLLVPHEEWGRSCHVLSSGPSGQGFAGIDFAAIGADYVPGEGLILSVPTLVYDHARGMVDADAPVYVHLIINTTTGAIDVRDRL